MNKDWCDIIDAGDTTFENAFERLYIKAVSDGYSQMEIYGSMIVYIKLLMSIIQTKLKTDSL